MLKLARKAQHARGQPGRFEFVCFDNSFHGRTLATVTATGQPKYQKGFEPLLPGVVHVPYGDLEAVRRAVGPRTAAILVEPVQGEGGVRAAPDGFLRALRTLADESGVLLARRRGADRAWAAPGRCSPSSTRASGPTRFSLAKGLANGLPIGAMVCTEEAGKALVPGTHGSTFGGNPVAAAAAVATVRLASDPRVLSGNLEKGEYFVTRGRGMQTRHPELVKDVRGRGLLLGVELSYDAAPVVTRCRERGMLCNLAGERTIRFAPPYIVTPAELDEGLRVLEDAVAALAPQKTQV